MKNVIHPTAKIIAKCGPIIIGDYNLIEENVCIINQTPGHTMTIGNHNVFEVGSNISTLQIGDHNVMESKCNVGLRTRITNGCVIGAMCTINYDEILPENTVIYGTRCERRLQQEKPSIQLSQIEFLGKILPNYQRIEKPNYRLPTTIQSSSTTTTTNTG